MMKKRCLLCGLILLLLLTACTTTKENPKKQTGEETAESLEKTDASFEAADKRSGQESLAGETEMNMSYPARFHEEIRILRAEDRLQMKKYEIPQEYGDKILKCGGPLTRGIVRADLYRLYDPEDERPVQPLKCAVGFYDLEKKQFTKIEDVERKPFSNDNSEREYLQELSEESFLYIQQREGKISYLVYHLKDASLTKLVEYPVAEDWQFVPDPVYMKPYLYIYETLPSGKTRLHAYNPETMEDRIVAQEGFSPRKYKDKELYFAPTDPRQPEKGVTLIGTDGEYRFPKEDGTLLASFDYTLEPVGDKVYLLTRNDKTDVLMEDIKVDADTPEDRKAAFEMTPYFEIRELTTGDVIFRSRGRFPEMSASKSWLTMRRAPIFDDDIVYPYLYIPEENIVLRFTTGADMKLVGPFLLRNQDYGILFGVQDFGREWNKDGVNILYAFEE